MYPPFTLSEIAAQEEEEVVNENVEIMQFTGLKGRKGKEIYEGDILKVSAKYFRVLRIDAKQENDYVCNVSHDDELAQFNIGKLTKHIIARRDLAKRYYEVIGNIYENPDLLSQT